MTLRAYHTLVGGRAVSSIPKKEKLKSYYAESKRLSRIHQQFYEPDDPIEIRLVFKSDFNELRIR